MAKADITLGVITGVCAIVCAGPLVPFALAALPRRGERARVIASLLGLSLLTYGGFYFVPRALSVNKDHHLAFSPVDPKRVFVMHAREMRETLWGYGPLAMAKEEDQGESWVFLGTDAAPLRPAVLDGAFGPLPPERPSQRRMLPYFPKDKKMRDAWEYTKEAEANPEGGWGMLGRFFGPHLDQVKSWVSGGPDLPKLRHWRQGSRCHVIVETPWGGYHSVNITDSASVTQWSFTEGRPWSAEGDALVVHHAAHGETGRRWDWWVDLAPGADGALDIEWAYTNVTETPAIASVTGKLAPNVTPIPQTTYFLAFKC